MPHGEERAALHDLCMHQLEPPKLWERESDYSVALFRFEFAVATGGYDEVLLAVDGVGHRCGLPASGEFEAPEFFAGIGVEGMDEVVHGGAGED